MKKRIAIFISTLHDEYQRILVKNFLKATESLDIQLSFFNGYSLLSPYGYQYVNNSIFSLVNTNNTDGIILTSTIFPFIKKSDVKEFLAKINKKNIPIVLFSYQIENYQCIITNPKKAIINAIEHLIYKHNAKKIAFIKGPENSEEANERFEAYIEGLKKNNIEFDSSLIIKGNFNKVDGYNGVEELIKKRKIFPDAIIASNDPMCIGALEYLKENNIKVPEEIKLIGFDDILETKTTIPAITTIKQPLEKMTRIAVELFLNKSENNIISVDSELVIRESCGCYNFKKPEPIVFNNKNITNLFTTIEKNSEEPIKKILEKIRLKIENNKFENSEDIKKIISLNSDNIEPTLNLLFKIKESLSLFITEMELLKNFEKLISEIIFYLYELKERFLLQELYKLFWNQSNFEYASQFITVSFNTQKLIENLKNTLNATRIKNFLLCLYNGKVKYKNKFDWIFPKTLKIILCYKDGRPIDKLENKNIKTSEIMPKDFLSNQNSSIFMPIYYENECLGYMIAAPIPDDTVSLTILRREISMVIKGTLLIERQLKTKEKLRKTLIQLQESNEKLEELSVLDELTGLYNRRGFYTVATKFIELAKRNHREFFIFYLDLNGLKEINDNYGHKEGDFAIKNAAEVLLKTFRHTDLVARMGGDEFVVMAIDCTIKDLPNIDNRLKENLKEINQKIQKPYKISICYGVAPYHPGKIYSLEELLEEADNNLYIEKRKFYS